MYIIITRHLVQILKSAGNDKVAVGKLTFGVVKTDDLQHSDKHFAGLELWHDHPTGETVTSLIKEGLSRRAVEAQQINPYKHVFKCRYDICQNYGYLKDGINKEAELRYTYGNPLVNMLCGAFDYKLELGDVMEEARKDSLVDVSAQSKLTTSAGL